MKKVDVVESAERPTAPSADRRPYAAPRVTKRRSIHVGVLASTAGGSTASVISAVMSGSTQP